MKTIKKTAVEQLEEYLRFTGVIHERIGTRCILQEEINKAKELEKKQIIDFAEDYELYESNKFPRKTFEKYYNENFANSK